MPPEIRTARQVKLSGRAQRKLAFSRVAYLQKQVRKAEKKRADFEKEKQDLGLYILLFIPAAIGDLLQASYILSLFGAIIIWTCHLVMFFEKQKNKDNQDGMSVSLFFVNRFLIWLVRFIPFINLFPTTIVQVGASYFDAWKKNLVLDSKIKKLTKEIQKLQKTMAKIMKKYRIQEAMPQQSEENEDNASYEEMPSTPPSPSAPAPVTQSPTNLIQFPRQRIPQKQRAPQKKAA